ncbi:MAG: alpha/beta hydrolase [Euryarchaeota archaeon]|nr:alpha/beta hydrolase [Euryarchaeota archaeon]MDE1837997.1 alpha/beta hydrolase [Euryarchaeota archaeon]MDE1880649.1 alpha/beta hydrolase [Euryarchaeota archaeon]MDE2046452.1 alpha/beta hydrolase [Thermoplasmata archaeon]
MASSEEQVQIASDDGARISLWKIGSGPPLLLIHDTAEDHTRWRPLYGSLASKFTILAMDRRGRGGSTDGPTYDYRREFEDVSEVLSQLGQDVNLLGLGWGAICALGAVRRVPATCVRRLVLYEPPIPVDEGPSKVPPFVIERLQGMLAGGDRDRVVSLYLTEVAQMNGAELEEEKTRTAWRGRVGAARTIPRELRARNDFRLDVDAYRELTTPTLLLEGAMSPDQLRRGTAWLHQVLASSRVTSLPGQKHVAMDQAPDVFLGQVVSFLQG